MRYCAGLVLLCCASPALAWFCPKNFNTVTPGDSVATVFQQCGAPDKQTPIAASDDNVPQRWTYDFAPPDATTQMLNSYTGQANQQFELTVIFNQGKVVNILLGGFATQDQLNLPNGCNPNVGDDIKTVINSCGKATFIQKNSDSDGSKPDPGNVAFIYNSSPPVTFIFNAGKLTDKQ